MTLIKNKNNLIFFAMYSAALSYLLLQLYFDFLHGGNSWKQGDWLISNLSVEIRRGYLGSFFILVADYFGVTPLSAVVITQAAIVTSIFVSVVVAVLRFGVIDKVLFVTISPAFLFFWVYDTQGSMRKEIIVYLAFAIILLGSSFDPEKKFFKFAAIAIYSVAVFSHEANAFFLPFFILIFYWFKNNGMPSKHFYIFAFYLIAVSFAALLNAVLNSKVDDFMLVCEPLLARGSHAKICGGAIKSLSFDIWYAVSRTANIFKSYQLPSYILIYLMSIVPIIYLWPEINRSKFRVIITVLGGFIFLPLYVVGIDWGRWINYYVVSLTMLLLISKFLDGRRSDMDQGLTKKEFFIFLVYCFSWSIPHCCGLIQVGRPIKKLFNIFS